MRVSYAYPEYWGLSSNAFLTVVTAFESEAPPSVWTPDKEDGDQNLEWGRWRCLGARRAGWETTPTPA
jgi:hypothetical protein